MTQLHEHTPPEHKERERPIVDNLHMCLVTASLLLGNAAQAEHAILEAIDLWDCGCGNDLFQLTLKAAMTMQIGISLSESDEEGSAGFFLPVELRRVLMLPPELRVSFVLRLLARVVLASLC